MKSSALFFCFLFLSVLCHAQKFGFINSEVILKKMPEYKKAEQELAQLSQKWQQEIEDLKKELEKMQKDYQAEEVLLTEEMKKERMAAIGEKEKALKEYQKKIFGFDGLIFLKRQELMKPVQDKVFEAVEKVAKEKQLQIVFDKASDLVMIYTNPIHDYTDYVLERLGLGDKVDTIQNNK
jgi:outer membrane protein